MQRGSERFFCQKAPTSEELTVLIADAIILVSAARFPAAAGKSPSFAHVSHATARLYGKLQSVPIRGVLRTRRGPTGRNLEALLQLNDGKPFHEKTRCCAGHTAG